MNQDLETQRSARDAISKFFSERYPEMVQQPILLLNYLHQHSFISRPTYTVLIEQQNPPDFVISCEVNAARTHGNGRSKKAARTHAAQQMLSLIQNCDTISNNSVENIISKPAEFDLDISHSQMQVDTIMTQCEELSFRRNAEYLSSPSQAIIAQPQGGGDTVVPHSLKRSFPCSESGSEDLTMDTSFDNGIDTKNMNGEILSDDFYEPYYPNASSQTSSIGSDIENIMPGQKLPKMINGSSKALTNELKTKSKSNWSIKDTKRVKLSSRVTSPLILDSYFDPFYKLKPHPVNTEKNNVQCATNVKVNVTPEAKSEKTHSPEPDVHKEEKSTKSPFAILQERSIKNYKLIPRSSIEKDGDGFRCILVLDSLSIHLVASFVAETEMDLYVKSYNEKHHRVPVCGSSPGIREELYASGSDYVKNLKIQST